MSRKYDAATTVNDLLFTIINSTAMLTQLAALGDDKAARALFTVAGQSNTALLPLLRAPGPLLRATMARVPSCPVNLPISPKRRDALVAEITKMGFGTGCDVNLIGKFNTDSPMSLAVAKVYMLCLREVRKNPKHTGFSKFDGKPGPFPGWIQWRDESAPKIPQRLTKANAPDWAKLSLPLLEIFWGDSFDTHTDFAQYRKSAAYKDATRGKLRGELRRMWGQAWRSMANS